MKIKRFYGFTLAEVLITIMVIGIVAVMVMNIFLSNVSENINSNRHANIAQKVTKAVELMVANGDYRKFNTTDEFVDKLQKYLSVIKRCDSNHIADCWPTAQVTTVDGLIDVSTAKKGTNINIGNNTDNVGLILQDGASIILTYNPEVKAISAEGGFIPSKKSLPIGSGKSKDFAYTSNVTEAIDFVMDVNGKKGPNSEVDENGNLYDIRSFKIASFGVGSCNGGISFSDYCFVDIGTSYAPISCADGANEEYCTAEGNWSSNLSVDYWAGVNKACNKMGMRQALSDETKALINSGKVNLTEGKYHTLSRNNSITSTTSIDNKGSLYQASKGHRNLGMCVKVKQ